jgi:uncharacterized lipoprotein NlpE involved in copper resistance
MKKTIFLLFAVILLIAGCNEKKLINQIDGTWHVQKYAVAGVDQTKSFDTLFANYQWNFSGTNSFTQSWNTITVYTLYNRDTITHLDTTTHTLVIDSITTSTAYVPTTIGKSVKGDWYLTNGNAFIETRDSVYGTKLYQIIDHSSSNLHLLYGNIDYYLAK